MSYPNTPVLDLQVTDTAADSPLDYSSRVNDDQQLSSSLAAIDTFAGNVTGSMGFTMFMLSGSVSDMLGDSGIIGSEYNRLCDRVIQEVIAWATTSGSGGVTTIDVLVQQGSVQPANFSTIYLGNNVYRPAVSSSLGNFGMSKTGASNFVSGSNMVWKKGSLLQAKLLTVAGAAGVSGQKNLTVQIFWKPSGSYGAGA